MFHLFDKVYFEFDTKISAGINRIVISEQFAAPLGIEPVKPNLIQFHYAKTVGELVGTDKEFATELDFFKGCKLLGDSNAGPLVVYCDKSAFLHLFISWNKSILENVSATDLWKIFRFSIEKETYLSKFHVDYVTFIEYSITNWSIEEFTTKFNNLNPGKDRQWNALIISSLGIEILLASYLLDQSSAVSDALKSKILLLTTRSLQAELYEAKFELIVNYQNKTLHDSLSVSDIQSLEELFSHPRTSIFVEQRLWSEESVLYPTGNGSALNVDAITDTDIPRLVDGFNLSRIELGGIDISTPQSDIINRLPWIVRASITDQELISLLANKVFIGASTALGDDDIKHVNVIFIDWILKLHRTENLSVLSDITVAV